ncbi:MAG TPA: CapA family protein [Longimicrobiales bacterium]|nr:CapA family protein [Longimicrobiales bacterium]
MKLILLGDVMLGRGVGAEILRRDPASFWGDTRELLLAADLVVANLECAITASAESGTPEPFHFSAPPEAVGVLAAGGVRAVTLANNHILDHGERGLRDTLRYLGEAGIAWTGAGGDAVAAARPAVVDARGTRVGLLGFTDNVPEWAAGPERAGVNYLPIGVDGEALERLRRGVDDARAAGAQLVVLSLHWGPNLAQRPSAAFREFARTAVNLGVDVVHGHSAHVFQGVELIGGRPVLYDTGDILDDYAVDPELRNDQALLFELERSARGGSVLRMIPVQLGFAVVDRALGAEAVEIGARMQRLSAELGTILDRRGAQLELRCTLGAGAGA